MAGGKSVDQKMIGSFWAFLGSKEWGNFYRELPPVGKDRAAGSAHYIL